MFHRSPVIDFFKLVTAIECTFSYARYTVWDCYACKTFAGIERIISYARYAVRDGYACQSTAIAEGRSGYAFTTCYSDLFERVRHIAIFIRITFGVENISKVCITASVFFLSDKWYGYACQTDATAERTISYTRYAVRDGYACKFATTLERISSYARYAVRNGYACQFATTVERVFADGFNAASDGDACKSAAIIERTFT